ncbi:hypothetical protein EDD86DRAFT_255792, partial [Gorgonomyces haynaldii]
MLISVYGFYLPGLAPKDYKKGDIVPLFVNPLTSRDTQLPFDYYKQEFHFCQPDKIESQSESLGSILMGDRFFNSPFQLKMMEETMCTKLCTQTIPGNDAGFINEAIADDYLVHWFVDGLPAANKQEDDAIVGFHLGAFGDNGPQFHNHYDIFIAVHEQPNGAYRVVGVSVSPASVKDGQCQSTVREPLVLSESKDNTVHFTYTLKFLPSSTPWGTRWDHYLHSDEDQRIHWFSVINSVLVVLLLSGMVFMILLRALKRDIARYNEEDQEDTQEEFGWKLVHGDIFRAPTHRMLLSVFIGNGAQLLLMALVTLFLAALGFLSPASRGSLPTVMFTCYILFSSVAGYISTRFYKLWGGEQWRRTVLLSASLVPFCAFVVMLFLNFFLIAAKSSAAMPFGTMVAILTLWFLVSLPLSLVGAFVGFKREKIHVPVRTHQIPRQIPEQTVYTSLWMNILIGGLLPFGAMFIELFFIMSSIWGNRVYYVFGFLFVVFLIMIITCSLIAILIVYFQLCAENYHWWWRSFFASGAVGCYIFLYSIGFYYTRLDIKLFSSTVLYFGWSAAISILIGLMMGTIGFLASFSFVKRIYSVIKVD